MIARTKSAVSTIMSEQSGSRRFAPSLSHMQSGEAVQKQTHLFMVKLAKAITSLIPRLHRKKSPSTPSTFNKALITHMLNATPRRRLRSVWKWWKR